MGTASAAGARAPATPRRIYRIRREHRAIAEAPRGYRHTLEARDEQTGEVAAVSHVASRITSSPLTIRDVADAQWTLLPHRPVLPTRWVLTDPAGRPSAQFDLDLARTFLRPLHRTVLVVLDGDGTAWLRVVDPAPTAERLLGSHRGELRFLRGDDPVATLTWLAPQPERHGVAGWLQRLLATRERGVVSDGDSHVLTAPAALAMVALLDELTP